MYQLRANKALWTSWLWPLFQSYTFGDPFCENNCHAECRHCNRFKADHLEGYRVNLIDKIGQQKFALLKVKAAGTTKMTDFEYEQLIKYYKTLNKKLRKEKGVWVIFCVIINNKLLIQPLPSSTTRRRKQTLSWYCLQEAAN